jgi:hypothetical protein
MIVRKATPLPLVVAVNNGAQTLRRKTLLKTLSVKKVFFLIS